MIGYGSFLEADGWGFLPEGFDQAAVTAVSFAFRALEMGHVSGWKFVCVYKRRGSGGVCVSSGSRHGVPC